MQSPWSLSQLGRLSAAMSQSAIEASMSTSAASSVIRPYKQCHAKYDEADHRACSAQSACFPLCSHEPTHCLMHVSKIAPAPTWPLSCLYSDSGYCGVPNLVPPPLKFGILLFRTEGYPNSCLDTFIQSKRQPKFYISVIFCAAKYEKSASNFCNSSQNSTGEAPTTD